MPTLQPDLTPSRSCILVVEADVVVRHPLAEYLRECGYRVLEAGDTDEAVEIIGNVSASIDVVLVDVTGPGKLDGFGLAHWIRGSKSGAKVILAATLAKVTGEAGDLCRKGSALSKPYDHQLLLDRVKRELARGNRVGKLGIG